MFRRNKKTEAYKSFDQWAKEYSDHTLGKNTNNKAEDKESKKTAYDNKNKPTVWRRFGDSKEVKELFPRPEDSKVGQMDDRSHEGKVNSRGSIKQSGVMGAEGSSGSNYSGVNPDLRRRLAEKKAQEKKAQRELEKAKKARNREKISAQQQVFKSKNDLRKSIITAEILGPPKAKKFS